MEEKKIGIKKRGLKERRENEMTLKLSSGKWGVNRSVLTQEQRMVF